MEYQEIETMTDFHDHPHRRHHPHGEAGMHGRAFRHGGAPGFGPGPGSGHHWHGGPPPWRGGRRARRGDIRWALLVSLLEGPAHGYELITRLEGRTGGMWRPSAGSVYPTLQMLEEEGLIKGRDEDGKRIFDLTDEGRVAAGEASERIGTGPWGEGVGHHVELRQAMRSLMLAVRQVASSGEDDHVAAATTVLTEARQRLYRILAGDAVAGDGGDAGPEAEAQAPGEG